MSQSVEEMTSVFEQLLRKLEAMDTTNYKAGGSITWTKREPLVGMGGMSDVTTITLKWGQPE